MKMILLAFMMVALQVVALHVVALQVVANSTIGFTLHRFQTLVHPVLKVGFEGCMKGFIDVIHLKKNGGNHEKNLVDRKNEKTWLTKLMRNLVDELPAILSLASALDPTQAPASLKSAI